MVPRYILGPPCFGEVPEICGNLTSSNSLFRFGSLRTVAKPVTISNGVMLQLKRCDFAALDCPKKTSCKAGTFSCHRLAAFSELHQQFCSEYKFNEWAPPADAVPDHVPPQNIAPTLPPLNLLATLQVHPWEDNDNATKGPEIPLQRHITTWIMKHLSSDPPDAPTVRMGQMKRLHQAQSILNVGPTREEDPRDYSILRNDMPNRENVDAPEKQPRLTYSVVGWMGPQYLAWKDHSGFAAGPSLTRQDYQSWFCQ